MWFYRFCLPLFGSSILKDLLELFINLSCGRKVLLILRWGSNNEANNDYYVSYRKRILKEHHNERITMFLLVLWLGLPIFCIWLCCYCCYEKILLSTFEWELFFECDSVSIYCSFRILELIMMMNVMGVLVKYEGSISY